MFLKLQNNITENIAKKNEAKYSLKNIVVMVSPVKNIIVMINPHKLDCPSSRESREMKKTLL